MIRLASVLMTGALLAAMTGCAAPTATPAPVETQAPPSAEPIPEPGPPARLVIGASGVSAEDDQGAELAAADYADGLDPVVAVITVALQDPVVLNEDSCGPTTYYQWGGVQIAVPQTADPADATITVTAQVAAVDGIAIESTPGIAVGDDVTQLISGLPSDQYLAENGSLVWEVTGTTDTGTETLPVGGVIYYSTEGLATAILAPGNFYSGYSC